jgi:DDE_Tnp_1-associated
LEKTLAVAVFSPLLAVLADVPDPRRAQGQLHKLPYVLLFSILAIVTGCNSYRDVVAFIDVHRRTLNAAFSLKWKRAPARTAVRHMLRGLDPAAVEAIFRRHAAPLQATHATNGQDAIALDGKTLRGSYAGEWVIAECLSGNTLSVCVGLWFEHARAPARLASHAG